ncbi:MAG: acetolactate synthase small subunit [Verrucomicrobia bacterium]|nr:acetolactate synthase small subunit [Kiritimatiellia bacterium]MCO6399822.1 acetolactate synthase small subunit [Verrucomicrobiota bacterium]
MTSSTVNPHIAHSSGLHTISVYVANKPGVLARVAQVFARRGYNIESLVVSPAMDGKFSRMTIGLSGNAEGMEQIIRQTSKLIDVLRCVDQTDAETVVKELALIKVGVGTEHRAEVLQIGEHFKCKNVDLTDSSMILQCTGSSEKLNALIGMLSKFPIIELVRTGKVLMARGEGLT